MLKCDKCLSTNLEEIFEDCIPPRIPNANITNCSFNGHNKPTLRKINIIKCRQCGLREYPLQVLKEHICDVCGSGKDVYEYYLKRNFNYEI